MTTLAVMRRFDLTDEQWARLESLLPVPVRSGRPPLWTKRQLIDGIRWRVRVGAPWRDVPECYGSWRAVYSLFRRWQRAGVLAAIVTGLQTRADASGRIIWEISVDFMITGRTSTPPAHAPLLRKSPRAASRLSPQITLWDAPAVASPPRFTWPASRGRTSCPCCSPRASAVTHPSSRTS